LLQEELSAMRQQRLQHELEALQRAQTVSVEEMTQKVEAAVDQLYRLKERLQESNRMAMREVLRQMISWIDLYFEEPPNRRRRRRYRFVKGVVTLRPQLELSGYEQELSAPAGSSRTVRKSRSSATAAVPCLP